MPELNLNGTYTLQISFYLCNSRFLAGTHSIKLLVVGVPKCYDLSGEQSDLCQFSPQKVLLESRV